MKTTHLFRKIAPVASLLLCAAAAFADEADPIYKNGSGLAIRGYDPAAYFTEQKPVKGLPQINYSWMGATWLFATAANRDHFSADPARYAPHLALANDPAQSEVPRCENSGRTLRHVAVVRSLIRVGTLPAHGAFAKELTLPLKNENSQSWRVVAFLQDSGSSQILGAAEAHL